MLISLSSSCLSSGIKKLGSSSSSTNTETDNTSSFTITVAFRDPSSDSGTPERTVALQGVSGSTSASFANYCNDTGSDCTCEFYTSTSDTSPGDTADDGISYSSTNNTITCEMESAIADASVSSYTYVRLKSTASDYVASGLIPIKTSLALTDILGSIDTTKARKIFQYGCDFTFLEGQGLSTLPGICTASQSLGLITATYNYYLYSGIGDSASTDNNTTKKGTQTVATACDFQFLQQNCLGSNGASVVKFGLLKEQIAPFSVKLSAPPAPNVAAETIGFAALPDVNNNCPTGLSKIRPYTVTPSSIVPGIAYHSSPNGPGTNHPDGIYTSFVNSSNTLNNQIFASTTSTPDSFDIYRQDNATTCAAGGSCLQVAFNQPEQIYGYTYQSQSPVLCVIPSSSVEAL